MIPENTLKNEEQNSKISDRDSKKNIKESEINPSKKYNSHIPLYTNYGRYIIYEIMDAEWNGF